MSASLRKRQLALPALLAVVVLAGLALGIVQPHYFAAAVMRTSRQLLALGPTGWLIFIAGVALVALIGIIPGALLGLAAGAVYGIAAGFLAGFIGIGIGAVLAFALARSTLRPWIARMLGSRTRLAAIDAGLAAGNWRIVALLRVSPIMPFSLTSYALGLSGISLRDYLLGTLAALPALLGYVTLGALGTSTLAASSTIHITLLLLGAIATLALTLHLTRLLTRALRG